MILRLSVYAVSLVPMDAPDAKPVNPPFVTQLTKMLGWLTWVAILACVVGVVITGARMALAWKGGGEANVAQLAWVMFGCILIGTASAIVDQFID